NISQIRKNTKYFKIYALGTLFRKGSIYIEKIARKAYIICENGQRLLTSYSLQELQTIFTSYDFIRCHQSVLVPLWRIRQIQSDEYNRRTFTVQLEGGDKPLPMSRERFDALESILIQRGIPIY
ncbi:MAG: LytTR family transcriptional regulator, partial [Oscillospiraceae bacterium]|nr:LytTR family transcriptional regulator [Oscillospiraceae bacterium]